MSTELGGVPTESMMVAAITAAIDVSRHFEQVDPSKPPADSAQRHAIEDRVRVYRECLSELAAGDALEAIDELVSFAANVVQSMASVPVTDAMDLLQSIALWPRGGWPGS